LAVEQLQDSRGGGSVRGEDIRQLLSKQFAMAYSLNGVYDLLKRLDMAWISAAPSAMANMMPASGVLKAAAIPAAPPAKIRVRRCCSPCSGPRP
jgi:transposase